MKYVIISLLALCLIADALHADSTNSTDSGIGDILGALSSLPQSIVESFFSYMVSGLVASTHQLVDSSFQFMFSSPNPSWFCSPYNAIMAIVEALYALVLMGVALYFILRSNDAEGRANAKGWLQNMLVMIAVLSFSFQIFQAMLDLNSYLAASFASNSMKSVFESPVSFGSAIFALVILFPSLGVMVLTLITLIVRYLLIPCLLLFFPFALFLYFVPITQKWGRAFLSITAAIVFMTAFDALLLLGFSSLFSAPDPNLADSLARAFAILFGFGALGLANLIIFILAILSIVFQDNSVKGLVGIAVAGKVIAK